MCKKILSIILFTLLSFSSTAYALSVYQPVQGGTGTSTIPIIGQILVGQSNGTYAPQATSTLGIGGSQTPWTSNIDGAGFNLNNVSIGTFNQGIYIPNATTDPSAFLSLIPDGSGAFTLGSPAPLLIDVGTLNVNPQTNFYNTVTASNGDTYAWLNDYNALNGLGISASGAFQRGSEIAIFGTGQGAILTDGNFTTQIGSSFGLRTSTGIGSYEAILLDPYSISAGKFTAPDGGIAYLGQYGGGSGGMPIHTTSSNGNVDVQIGGNNSGVYSYAGVTSFAAGFADGAGNSVTFADQTNAINVVTGKVNIASTYGAYLAVDNLQSADMSQITLGSNLDGYNSYSLTNFQNGYFNNLFASDVAFSNIYGSTGSGSNLNLYSSYLGQESGIVLGSDGSIQYKSAINQFNGYTGDAVLGIQQNVGDSNTLFEIKDSGGTSQILMDYVGQIFASKFVKASGSSDQFLMADGSTQTQKNGTATLVSGTKTITISGVTSSSKVFVQLVTPGGTLGAAYKAVAGTNSITITAVTVLGATVTTDTSTLNYNVII